MPKNNNVEVVKLPMVQKWNKKPTTEFKNNLDSIKVSLVSYPSMDNLRSYLPQFLDATWAENPDQAKSMTLEEKDNLIKECIKGKALPTALETVGLVWQIEGISLQEVTHILRYRNASFSADCSADKWWTDKAALVPSAIEQSDEFYERYKKIVEDSKQLYCDMIDSKDVSILDARMILPRCLETFYFMRMNLGDTLHFIYQRIDKQIQPETDNIIAYQMYRELLKVYPIMNDVVDIHAPASFYVKMHNTGRTSNIYFPDKDSDVFDWNEDSFIYQKHRNELNGTNEDTKNINHFEVVSEEIEKQITALHYMNNLELKRDYKEDKNTVIDEFNYND